MKRNVGYKNSGNAYSEFILANRFERSSYVGAQFIGNPQRLTAISFPKQASQKSQTSADFRRSKDNAKLGMPVYILTEAGEAIASILPNHEFESSKLLAQTLAEKMPGVEIHRYVSTPEGGYLAAGIECVRKSSQDEVGVD